MSETGQINYEFLGAEPVANAEYLQKIANPVDAVSVVVETRQLFTAHGETPGITASEAVAANAAITDGLANMRNRVLNVA